MEENRGLILYGCTLAKTLEENLPNLANQPEVFLRSCDEIISVFRSIKERLSPEVVRQQFDAGIQEWIRSSGTSTDQQAMDLLNAQAIFGGSSTYHDAQGLVHGAKMKGVLLEHQQQPGLGFTGHEIGGAGNVEGGAEGVRSGRGLEIKPTDALNPSPGTPSSQRQRRRNDDADKIVRRVPAPRMGNLDTPPEDGFTWRKYGQKEILGYKHPRSYYRCTHQRLYQCPAKKQVQRLDDDFYTFEVTYRGNHTCNISTAPSASIPPPSIDHGTIPQTTAMQPPASHWLSMEINPSPTVEATPTIFDAPALRYPSIPEGAGTSASGSGSVAAGGSGSAGPSGPRFPEYQPVADLADAMFNSGSSSNNSMEFFFPSIDENWDTSGEKKN